MGLIPLIIAHEGHEGTIPFLLSIGEWHLILLHFPIALIIMTAVAEVLFAWKKNILFEQAARFMLISAAILTPITALFGFALGFGQVYPGVMADLYAWHRYFGIVTTILVLWAVSLRENWISGTFRSYLICLFFLSISLIITGFLGSTLTFGWL